MVNWLILLFSLNLFNNKWSVVIVIQVQAQAQVVVSW